MANLEWLVKYILNWQRLTIYVMCSKLRHNKLVRSRSAETLDSEIAARDDQVICPEKFIKNSEESQGEGNNRKTDLYLLMA